MAGKTFCTSNDTVVSRASTPLTVFLGQVKGKLKKILSLASSIEDDISKSKLPTVTIIMGNQASDADSVVTALVLAFIKSQLDKNPDQIYVPLVSAPRDDFEQIHPLEPFFMSPFVDIPALLYVDEELPLMEKLHACGKLEIILTDHNKLEPKLHSVFSDAVVEIFDHHQDQKCYPKVKGAQRTIGFDDALGRGLGSACTLIGAFGLKEAPALMAKATNGLASMLLSVILVDTVALDSSKGKTMEQDRYIAAALNKIVGKPLQGWFAALSAAKFDPKFWAKRTISQCLRYDFKKYDMAGVRYGASSLPLSLADFVAKEPEAWGHRLKEWMRSNKLDFLLVLTNTVSAEISRRELAVFSVEAEPWGEFISALEKTDLSLKVSPISAPAKPPCFFRAWSQGNLKRSRKRITPLVDAFLMGRKASATD